MAAITFDPPAFSRRLQEAGMPAGQADAFAEAQKQAIDEAVAARDLATKSDLEKTRNELRNELLKSRNELRRWMTGMLLAQTALIVAVIVTIIGVPAG